MYCHQYNNSNKFHQVIKGELKSWVFTTEKAISDIYQSTWENKTWKQLFFWKSILKILLILPSKLFLEYSLVYLLSSFYLYPLHRSQNSFFNVFGYCRCQFNFAIVFWIKTSEYFLKLLLEPNYPVFCCMNSQ